jgi:hypothetical protein
MNKITIEPFVSASMIKKHEREIDTEKGGISVKNQSEDGFFQVFMAFSKKISGKLIQGKFNFSTMQRPGLISMPESHLQLIAYEFALMLKYFKAATDEKDPLERLKLITAGMIGSLSYNVYRSKGKGPINPTLGETFKVASLGHDERWN